MFLNSFDQGKKFQDLKDRCFFVLFGILFFRIGIYIPIPLINYEELSSLIINLSSKSHHFFSMFNIFSGGALEKLSIFSLGLIPYISSSIIFQMLSSVSPFLIELKKDGESGEKKNKLLY